MSYSNIYIDVMTIVIQVNEMKTNSGEIIKKMNAEAKECGTFRLNDQGQELIYTKKDGTEKSVNFWGLIATNQTLYLVKPGYTAKSSLEAEILEKQGHCVAISISTLSALRKVIKEERQQKQLENLHLVYAGRTEDFGRVYRLSTRVPREIWEQIKEYFLYASEDDELGGDADDETLGWVTTNPEVVEKTLNVKTELTIDAQQKRAEQKKQQRKEHQEIQQEIIDAFRDAEKPDPRVEQPEYSKKFRRGSEKMLVEGERIDDPFYRQNLYGGGQWWVIQPDYIWLVRNNGADGDDWSQNNVETGGAGAIGVRVPFSSDLAEKIRRYLSKQTQKED